MSTSSAVFALSLGFSYPELNRFISPWSGCGCTRMFHRVTVASSQYIRRVGWIVTKRNDLWRLCMQPALCHLPVFATRFSPLKRSESSRPSSSLRHKYETRLHVSVGLLIISTGYRVFVIIFRLIVENAGAKRLMVKRMKGESVTGWTKCN